MKRILSFSLAIVMLVVAFGTISASAEETKTYGADNLNDESGDLIIGFIGGSITEGAGTGGIDTWQKRYSTLTIENFFKKKFPNKNVIEVNRAIGGTNSAYGHIRMAENFDFENSKTPDVMFVEFAVNDYGPGGMSITENMESMVRQLLVLPKVPVIIFIYTTSSNSTNANGTAESSVENAIAAHHVVAERYGIYEINLNDYIWQGVREEKWSWDKDDAENTLTGDNTHPNVKGHKLYADRITDMLTKDYDKAFVKHDSYTIPCGDYVYGKIENIPLSDKGVTKSSDWTFIPRDDTKDNIINKNYPARFYKEGWFENTDCVGETIEYTFTGRSVGLNFARRSDNAQISWEIYDENSERIVNGIYNGVYASYESGNSETGSGRCYGEFFKTGLPYGEYKVKFTFTKTNNPVGTGTHGSIGYIVVETEYPEIYPVAENVKMKVAPEQCKYIGEYQYKSYMDDTDNYSENGTTVCWYLSETDNSKGTKVSDSTEYILTEDAIGKYLRFAVTPKNKVGTIGKEYLSESILALCPSGQVYYKPDVLHMTEDGKEFVLGNIVNIGNFETSVSVVVAKFFETDGYKTLTEVSCQSLTIFAKDNTELSVLKPKAENGEIVKVFIFCSDTIASIGKMPIIPIYVGEFTEDAYKVYGYEVDDN